MEDIPKNTLFAMLKKNLNNAQMLTYIFLFNAPSWVEELDFLYGARDKEQWKVKLQTILASITIYIYYRAEILEYLECH